MKKSVIIAVLGVAASAASSYGQGYIYFSSYVAPGSPTINLFSSPSSVVPDSTFDAALYFAIGTVTDPVSEGTLSSVISAPSGSFTLLTGANLGGANTGTYPAPVSGGNFDGVSLVVPGYTSGAITFEVVAYNGSTYANSTMRGRSGDFTMTSINANAVYSNFGDNGANMPSFLVGSVAPVPEPTTLALAGLGGLASLIAFRRKQA